jgi:hypothetical protein
MRVRHKTAATAIEHASPLSDCAYNGVIPDDAVRYTDSDSASKDTSPVIHDDDLSGDDDCGARKRPFHYRSWVAADACWAT